MASSGKSEAAAARAARCPTCGAAVTAAPGAAGAKPPHFPFCSLRCQLADLGKWLDEDYKVAGEPVTPPGGGPGPDES
jgi:endogenous inhibitor of DNA gyrase (YacG/DUF329 family)